LIEKGKVSELIRSFLNGLKLTNIHFPEIVTKCANDIAGYEENTQFWKSIYETEKDYTKQQIALLWIGGMYERTKSCVHFLTIQELSLEVAAMSESPEFDAAQRKKVREEIKKVFEEVQQISQELNNAQPDSRQPDPRLVQ
jgi:hypothetical protein